MEVGIEDCLHIEFEYGRGAYHLKDVVVGKIYFLLVRCQGLGAWVVVAGQSTRPGGAATHTNSKVCG